MKSTLKSMPEQDPNTREQLGDKFKLDMSGMILKVLQII